MKESMNEAERWILQAEDDFRFVKWVQEEDLFYDKGCFIAQQSGEKAVKACLYASGERSVIGHSILDMLKKLSTLDKNFENVLSEGKRLDRFYIPTRYPNGLPGGSPFQTFDKEDLSNAVNDLIQIIEICQKFLNKFKQ